MKDQGTWVAAGVLLLILVILWSRKSLYDTAQNVATLQFANGLKYMVGYTDGPAGSNSRATLDIVPPANAQRSTYAMPYY